MPFKLPDSNMMRMAAIALSGFSLDKNAAIWRSQCGLAHKQIDDPYLRVTFAFLAPDAENYDNVLVSEPYLLPALSNNYVQSI